MSQTAFGQLGEAGKTTVISWERGTAFPNAAFLSAVAKAGVDVLYVLTGERAASLPAGLSAEEQLLVESYRALPVTRRKAVLADLLTGGAARPAARKAAGGVVVTGNNNRTSGGNYDEK